MRLVESCAFLRQGQVKGLKEAGFAVIDNAQLLSDKLHEWEDFTVSTDPTAASTDRPPTND